METTTTTTRPRMRQYGVQVTDDVWRRIDRYATLTGQQRTTAARTLMLEGLVAAEHRLGLAPSTAA